MPFDWRDFLSDFVSVDWSEYTNSSDPDPDGTFSRLGYGVYKEFFLIEAKIAWKKPQHYFKILKQHKVQFKMFKIFHFYYNFLQKPWVGSGSAILNH